MNSRELLRILTRHGCAVRPAKGSHVLVQKDGRTAVLPWRSGRKQLASGTLAKIRKTLNLKEESDA
jgi:predicted RNA binding protein YcfA (HicA-like mRNA interferase family)